MRKLDKICLEKVMTALSEYERCVENANLMPSTQQTYLLHANNFVRWLDGDFEPGSRAGSNLSHADRNQSAHVHKESIEVLQEKAEEYDELAQYELGKIYEEGVSVIQSYSKAIEFYKSSAYGGYAPADIKLGNIYQYGLGVDQDDTLAAIHYHSAAIQGFTEAQISLARVYKSLAYTHEIEFGDDETEYNLKAYIWFSIAAVSGSEEFSSKYLAHIKSERNSLAHDLSHDELSKAEDMAKKCLESNYQDCPTCF